MPLTKLFHYRANVDGAIPDSATEPENPWLRKPKGIAEQLEHAEAMHEIQAQLKAELLGSRRFVDMAPLPAEEARLAALYAKDRTAPSAEHLLVEVADAAEQARNHRWEAILERLERAYCSKGG